MELGQQRQQKDLLLKIIMYHHIYYTLQCIIFQKRKVRSDTIVRFPTSPNKSRHGNCEIYQSPYCQFSSIISFLASPSRRVSNNTVSAIKGIIADAIIVLSNTDKEEVPDMEVRERRIRTPEIIVAFA